MHRYIQQVHNREGFGLLALVVALAILAILVGGGLYLNSEDETKSTIEIGIDAIEKAQDIKDTIEKRDESHNEIE